MNVVQLFPKKTSNYKCELTSDLPNPYKDASLDIICLGNLEDKLSKANNSVEYCMIAMQIANDIQSILKHYNINKA
jgi:hypothetical protein